MVCIGLLILGFLFVPAVAFALPANCGVPADFAMDGQPRRRKSRASIRR